MRFHAIRILLFLICWSMFAQQGQPKRIIVVSPMTGDGTREDPKRPLAVGWGFKQKGAAPVSFRYVMSDDGRLAIVEMTAPPVGAEGAEFWSAVERWTAPGTKIFDPDKHSRAEVEDELKKLKKDFSVDDFAGEKQNGGKK